MMAGEVDSNQNESRMPSEKSRLSQTAVGLVVEVVSSPAEAALPVLESPSSSVVEPLLVPISPVDDPLLVLTLELPIVLLLPLVPVDWVLVVEVLSTTVADPIVVAGLVVSLDSPPPVSEVESKLDPSAGTHWPANPLPAASPKRRPDSKQLLSG